MWCGKKESLSTRKYKDLKQRALGNRNMLTSAHTPITTFPAWPICAVGLQSTPTDVLGNAFICFSHQAAAPSTLTQDVKPELVRLPRPPCSHARQEAKGSHLTSSSWLDNLLQEPLQKMFPVLKIIHIIIIIFPWFSSLLQAAEHPTAVRDLAGYRFGSHRWAPAWTSPRKAGDERRW